jgi:hypothetical protein
VIEDKGFAVVMIADVDMTRSSNLIDFRELVSAVPGEGLEELVRHIGHKKNLLPNFSGRGADGGRDLFFTETLVGEISIQKLKWLVSCKDKALRPRIYFVLSYSRIGSGMLNFSTCDHGE